jgi:hypothetical protein
MTDRTVNGWPRWSVKPCAGGSTSVAFI